MADLIIMRRAIKTIEFFLSDPHKGLPEEVFLFASRITPMVNVDLLIKNERGDTLLTWRDDGYCKAGWHIPGGIIRYKETTAERIRAVAKTEIGADVFFQPDPIAINELIQPGRKNRGHFISLLYHCSLKTVPDKRLQYLSGAPQPDQWMWHSTCPEDIIVVHEIYRKFI